MLINEAIRRADALIDNEYSLEEKYSWCDAVSAELKSLYSRKYRRAKLFRWTDGKFLLPQDCSFEYIEQLIYMGHEIEKQDMRTFGFVPEQSGSGRKTHGPKRPASPAPPARQRRQYGPDSTDISHQKN